MSSTRSTVSTGVRPSISQLLSSRLTICRWLSLTRSPITVLITSLRVIRPTTSAYSFSTMAMSSRLARKWFSSSDSVSESGMVSTGLIHGAPLSVSGSSFRMRASRSFDST